MVSDFDALWEMVAAQSRSHECTWSVHGPEHWRRVERNGLLLAKRTGADIAVVRLFALFHDSRRENDGVDDGHGRRGAAYAATLRGKSFRLSDGQFDLLLYACIHHTDGGQHDDPTIGTCWDSDRLDLGRVGIVPRPRYMSTDFAREIAGHGTVEDFLKRNKRA